MQCVILFLLFVRLTEAIQCLAFNPIIHSLMSCACNEIGKSAVLHFPITFFLFILILLFLILVKLL